MCDGGESDDYASGISDVVDGNGGVVGGGGGSGITGSFSNGSNGSNSGNECVVGGVSDGSNVGGDSGDNNNSASGKFIVWYKLLFLLLMSYFVKDLSSIRNCITNGSGENKVLQCVLFFDQYRKLRCNEISSSRATFMPRTIRPMAMCFR